MDMDRTHACERICSLFTIELRIPKLDIAGSIPVSRYLKSTTWRLSFTVLPNNYQLRETSIHQSRSERFNGIDSAFQGRFGVNVQIHVERVPLLIRDDLRINSQPSHAGRMRGASCDAMMNGTQLDR